MTISSTFPPKVSVRRNHEHEFHQRLFKHREDTCAYDFLDDKRHGDDIAWLDFRECLHDYAWRRGAGQYVDMVAADEGAQHVDGQAIHVGKRKHAHDAVAGICGEIFEAELHV